MVELESSVFGKAEQERCQHGSSVLKEFKMTKTENGTEVPDEEQEKLMASAYTELLLNMNFNSREGENAFNLVKWSKDNEGRGNAREAWKRLIERYEPKTYLEKGKLMREFFLSLVDTRKILLSLCINWKISG